MTDIQAVRRWLLQCANKVASALSGPTVYCWLGLYWGLFLAPLLMASMSRPFAWWDLLTLPSLFHGSEASWQGLLPGYLQSFHNAYIVRPTTALMHDLQLLLFHGQFWLWYLLKWVAMGCALFVVVRILRERGAHSLVSAAVVGFLLFHTVSFKLMLSAPDGFVALGGLILIWLAAPKDHPPFVLAHLSNRRYAVFLLVFFFTLGVKEVAYAFCGILTVTLAFYGGRRSMLRIVPLCALMLLWTWMFAAAGGRTRGLSPATLQRDLLTHLSMLVPESPLAVLKVVLIILCCYSLRLAVRKAADRPLIMFCFVAAAAMLLFTSTTGVAAARYVIPAIYLMAIPVGLALRSLNAPPLVLAGFLVIYPLLTAGDLFAQELAYQQLLYECGEAINLLEAKGSSGYRLAVSGTDTDVGLEYQGTLQRFFDHYGPRFYGTPRFAVHRIAEQGVPAERFALLSSLPAEEIIRRRSELAWRLEATQRGTRNYYGVLEVMTAYFGKLDGWIGNAHVPRYDNGAPVVTPVPVFYIHTFSASEAALPANTSNPLEADELHFVSSPTKPIIWKIPVGSAPQARLLVYSGEIEVKKGSVTFGIARPDGSELWSVPLGPGVQALPAVPASVPFGAGESYSLSFAPSVQPTEFVLRKFKMSTPVEMGTIPRIRRYGSVMP